MFQILSRRNPVLPPRPAFFAAGPVVKACPDVGTQPWMAENGQKNNKIWPFAPERDPLRKSIPGWTAISLADRVERTRRFVKRTEL